MPTQLTDRGKQQAQALAAVSGGAAAATRASGAASRQKWRASLCIASVLGGSTLWILALFKLNAAIEALPWCFTITFIAVLCGLEAVRAALRDADVWHLPGVKDLQAAMREPVSLLESWSIAFGTASAALFGWVYMHSAMPQVEPTKLTRFIDIQLVSSTDFKDEKSPLPGQQEQAELRKRQSDQITQQGSLTPVKPQRAKPENSAREQPKETNLGKQEQTKQTTTASNFPSDSRKQPIEVATAQNKSLTDTSKRSQDEADKPFAMIAHPQVAQIKKQCRSTPSTSQSMFEEVQPPELVELIENDGTRDATPVFTSGGKSQGGTGAANELSTYIKELHHKIKSSWAPPRGQSRRARVLFRIRHDGKLSFTKIAVSSGDDDTDIAAVTAITSAVGARPLPADYREPYLDVEYTFNYMADEIKEIRDK